MTTAISTLKGAGDYYEGVFLGSDPDASGICGTDIGRTFQTGGDTG